MKFKGSREAPEIDPASVPTLRALALELNRHPNWIVAVGVRPKTESTFDQQAALAQAFAAVETVRGFALRDAVAETVGWRAVSTQPGVWANGFGALLFVQLEPAPAQAAPVPDAPAAPAGAPAPAPGVVPGAASPGAAAPAPSAPGAPPAPPAPTPAAPSSSSAPSPPASGASKPDAPRP
jgi:hypothetical protein